jgi:NAD(P)-dependent dehydrogenase (short-subunit alcohol dehydrogenase family)
MSKSTGQVFLITGVSSGFGRAFAEAALTAGNTVIGTVRSEAAKAEFEKLHVDLAHGVILDVTDFAAIEPAVNQLKAIPARRANCAGRHETRSVTHHCRA